MSPKGYERTKQFLAIQLFDAIEEKNLQEVLKLLDNDGADPNMVIPERGISPFHLVIGCECSYFAEETTRAFLQRNGNPNVRSEDGLTPVHVAAVWGRTSLLVLLLSCGGDPRLRDSEHSFTPLQFALKEEHWESAFLLQRYQLVDRHNRHSEIHINPRFNINLETVVVSAGEMQAEYTASPQDNVSPVLMSPVQACRKSNNGYNWNLEPLGIHDYVGQWCHKEFTPVTSTPTNFKPLNCANLVYEQPLLSPSTVCTMPNITSSKEMTPKTVEFGANNLATKNLPHTKNLSKAPNDVRKKLFLELKKRFNGLKQSFDSSKDDPNKENAFNRKASSGYFSRKSFSKSRKVKDSSSSQQTVPSLPTNDDNKSCSSDNGSFFTSRSVASQIRGNESQNINCNPQPSLENSPVDEVDAIPLDGFGDTSVEWIASHSCFSEEMSPDSSLSQSYFTCDEGQALTPAPKLNDILPMVHSLGSISLSRPSIAPEPSFEVPQRPPRRKDLKAMNSLPETVLPTGPSSTSFGTIVSEEYRYTDDEAGVILIESHLLIKPVDVPSPSDCESVVSVPHTVLSEAHTAASDVSSVPASFCFDAAALRRELVSLGETVGPITSTTKTVYLRRLYHLKKKKVLPLSLPNQPLYPSELQRVLNNDQWEEDLKAFSNYEVLMNAPFENPDPNRRWREGVAKSSFNYLLLDPRLSQNLPATVTIYDLNTWRQFISAVFYVGKGKRSRPYAHLYQAVHSWRKGEKIENPNKKVQRILDIWRDGHGVVCLHVFQNIIPVEAFTREAAMLDAIGMNNIVNIKSGEYYGPASTWRIRQKRQLGVYLLYRAMRIFLCEGERQLRPGDID